MILTLQMDAASAATFTQLRRRHFPPPRNWLDAHITLHALPRERSSRKQAGAWMHAGPEYYDQAEFLSLEVGGELAHATDSCEKLQRRFKAANDAS